MRTITKTILVLLSILFCSSAHAVLTFTVDFNVTQNTGSDSLGLAGSTATVTIVIDDSINYSDFFGNPGATVTSASIQFANAGVNSGTYTINPRAGQSFVANPHLGASAAYLLVSNTFEASDSIALNSGALEGILLFSSIPNSPAPSIGDTVEAEHFTGLVPKPISINEVGNINNSWTFTAQGGLTAVPEPSSACLLGLSASALFFRKRRSA